jgi:hypothetical protein
MGWITIQLVRVHTGSALVREVGDGVLEVVRNRRDLEQPENDEQSDRYE